MAHLGPRPALDAGIRGTGRAHRAVVDFGEWFSRAEGFQEGVHPRFEATLAIVLRLGLSARSAVVEELRRVHAERLEDAEAEKHRPALSLHTEDLALVRVQPVLLHDRHAGDLPRAAHRTDLLDERLQLLQCLPAAQVADLR